MLDYIKAEIQSSYKLKKELFTDLNLMAKVLEVAQKTVTVYRSGHKILIAGNGGSAADAQHLAAELVGRFNFDRPGLPALALTMDTSILTAVGNDYGFEQVFARQVAANGQAGDLFIGLSTSGNSGNIIQALRACKERGITTAGFTGKTGGKMAYLCDVCLCVPSTETPRIQEAHIMIGHIICSVIEKTLFWAESAAVNEDRSN